MRINLPKIDFIKNFLASIKCLNILPSIDLLFKIEKCGHMDKNLDIKSLINDYKEILEKKEKHLNDRERFLEQYAIQLNEKEDELAIKEQSIQKFLKAEIDSIINDNNYPKEKREPLIKKITQDMLLHTADEIEEDDLRERKFLRNEYKKLKHNLLHELEDIQFDSEYEEEDFDIDDVDIERIKQELKDELDYLEKRHPAQSSRMTKQNLIDLRTFDSSSTQTEEEAKIIQNYLDLYEKAKSKYDKFIFLT